MAADALQAAWDALPYVLQGVPYTIGISVAGLAGGFFLGVLLGLAGLGQRLWRLLAMGYTELFRGTPLLVQALFLFYGLPQLIGRPIGPLTASVVVVAMNAAAYIAEIVRGAMRSISPGQREAGLALGLSVAQVYVWVIWPQAFRRMIPGLGNQAITSIKDTSILSVIGVGEMVRQGQIYIATTFQAFEVYALIALLYLIMTLGFSALLRHTEHRLQRRGGL